MSDIQDKIKSLEKITNTKILTPIKIIFLDIYDKWAISAFKFKDKDTENVSNHIGIHYYDNNFPANSWLIIPRTLEKSILDVIQLKPSDRKLIEDFLSGTKVTPDLSNIKTVVVNRV